MKDQLKTIREALLLRDMESCEEALAALTKLEAMAQKPVARLHVTETDTYPDIEVEVLDGTHLQPGMSPIPVYVAAPVAQQYEAGDMASAAAQGFGDGVASVAQQPQARPDFTDEWTGYLKDGETPFERFLRERKDLNALTKLYQRVLEENERLKAQQPQAEPDIHEAQGQIEFLDKKNNALSAAIRKVMARLADLLDEDQFKEIEEIVSFAGVQPQAEAVPLTHVLVPVDEPTDEMVDAACAAVDGLCRVDFVRAYVAAFAHLKAGYRDESYWCGWNAAIKFQQAEAVPVVDRVYEAAKRLVDHADFQLGGVLSAKSKARDIPSNAASKVKARHLASLRDALAKTPQQAEAVPSDVVRDAAPIPDHELVTMYDERPTSDLEMIEFAREVERRHGIGVQPKHITDGSPCWCNPDVAYTDPETGASVILHRRPQ